MPDTERSYIKICSTSLPALTQWAREQVGGSLDRGCYCVGLNAARVAPRLALARGAISRSFVSIGRVVQVRLDRRLCASQPVGDLRDRQVVLLAIVSSKRRGAARRRLLTRSLT